MGENVVNIDVKKIKLNLIYFSELYNEMISFRVNNSSVIKAVLV